MASRLAPEPARQTHHSDHPARSPKQEKKRSRAPILIAVLCAVLLALYCALCAFGGSGDTLTGIIAALLGQGLSSFDAARLGAFLHGRAGERAAEKRGVRSMIASDIIDVLDIG